MNTLPYEVIPDDPSVLPMGLVVLQSDETLEPEFRHYFSDHPNPMYVTRIPSSDVVTKNTLSAMEHDLPAAAKLLPKARRYAVVGYGCTSASTIIGSDRVAALVQQGCDTCEVTNPLRAAAAVAASLGVARLALVSPYVEEVNAPLRAAFARLGLSTDVFGTFSQSDEATVARIRTASVVDAAVSLGRNTDVDAVFLSCTNLRTLDAIPRVEAILGKPVLSSNQVLATHMKWLCAQQTGTSTTRN